MRPWREGTDQSADQRAAEVVRQTHALPPRAVELASGWEDVLRRATKPRTSAWKLVLAGSVALLVGVVGTKAVMGPREVVVAESGAQWAQREDGAVQLQHGSLRTTRRVTLRVESPQVTILARECRFAAEVISEGTRVTVFEGTAVVRSGEGVERSLNRGDSVLWPALPIVSQALAPTPARSELCPGTERVACLEGAAAKDDLQAEVASFELGRAWVVAQQPVKAITAWQSSLQRFPDGVFEPEVRLSLLTTLTQQHRFEDALIIAREFEALHLDDPRREEVIALRKQLEWLTTKR